MYLSLMGWTNSVCWRTTKVCPTIKLVPDVLILFLMYTKKSRKRIQKRPSKGWKITHQENQRKSIKKQWGSFLSNGGKKPSWLNFWQADGDLVIVHMIRRSMLHIFSVNVWPNNESELRPELTCKHEVVGIHMLLHAKQISKSNSRNTIIYRPNTDVLRIEIAASNQTDANLLIRTGKKNTARIFSIPNVKKIVYTHLFLNALLGLHVFTGWDTVSAFFDKGKVKLLKLMMKN